MASDRISAVTEGHSRPVAGVGADPAADWLHSWRSEFSVDVQSLAQALLLSGPELPDMATVEAMLTPVERGELAAAMDAAVDRREMVTDRVDSVREAGGIAGDDATTTQLTTTDQRIVVRRAEAMLHRLDQFGPAKTGLESDLTAADQDSHAVSVAIEADPSSEPVKPVEVLPPLPPGAELPPPVTSRSD